MRKLVAVVPLLLLTPPPQAWACDSTSCAVVTRGRDGVSSGGSFRVDLSFRHFALDRKVSADPSSGQVLVPWIDFRNSRLLPAYHSEAESGHSVVQLDASYGLTSRLTLTAAVPFVRRSFGYLHVEPAPALDGATPQLEGHEHGPLAPEAAVVEQRYRTSGLGDIQPGVRYAVRVTGTSRIVTGIAVRIPTGAYDQADATRAIHNPLFQPASGAWATTLSFQYTRQPAQTGWSVSGSYQRSSENSLGYQLGDEAFGAMGLGGKISKRVYASAQVKLSHAGRSRYLGADVPSTGGTLGYFTTGVRFDLPGESSLYAFVPIPVYEAVRGPQVIPRFSVLAGVSKEF